MMTLTIAKPVVAQTSDEPKGWFAFTSQSRIACIPSVSQPADRCISELECNEMLFGMQEWVHGFICAKCGGEHFYVIKGNNVRQCAACHRQSELTAGTIFESVPVSLSVWFKAIDAIINARQLFVFNLAKTLRVNYTTAWLVKNQLERALKNPSDRQLVLEIAQALR